MAAQPTDWAKYPALGLFAAAVLSFLADEQTQVIWPVLLITAGATILLVQAFRKRR